MAKILVVDDSTSMRNMVSLTLQTQQHEVVEAVDGLEGLEKSKSQKYDLVITDVNMPNMDGIELCQCLRQTAQFRFTPILILTTESSLEMKMKGKAAGATGWLVKPFNPDKLLATIKRVIR